MRETELLPHVDGAIARAYGNWLIERRNVVEDYRALFGEIPERAVAIRMQINSQHTNAVAEAFWRTIRFTSE